MDSETTFTFDCTTCGTRHGMDECQSAAPAPASEEWCEVCDTDKCECVKAKLPEPRNAPAPAPAAAVREPLEHQYEVARNLFVETNDALVATIKRAESAERELAELRRGWIPVEERLPEFRIPVLVHGGVAELRIDGWWTYMECPKALIKWKVTHWRPLPGRPEAGEEKSG